MEYVRIPLSEPQQAFVDAQVAEGKYPDAEACVAAAVQAAAEEWAQDKLEAMLLEGLESPGAPWTSESMDEVRLAARARL
ncbi:hypothetical protein [uncultured Sphingomonas sp.]|uniref:hypothetical protein n=1 Tax=uncultured Sphingomonas sp. TaxID=158754 RepID=UPI0035CA9203